RSDRTAISDTSRCSPTLQHKISAAPSPPRPVMRTAPSSFPAAPPPSFRRRAWPPQEHHGYNSSSIFSEHQHSPPASNRANKRSWPYYFLAFHNPTVLPSESCIQANVPAGISTGGTSIFPPSAFAFSRQAATSSTST